MKTIKIKCKSCSKEFWARPCDKRKYCSWKCYKIARPRPQGRKKKERPSCLICGKEVKRWHLKYCSSKCYGKTRIGVERPELWKRTEKKCEQCGKVMVVGGRAGKKHEQRYCSRSCSSKSLWVPIENQFTKGKSGRWKERRNQVLERDKHKCVYCGRTERLQVNHKIPRQMNGSHEKNNLETVCRRCHWTVDIMILWSRSLPEKNSHYENLIKRL